MNAGAPLFFGPLKRRAEYDRHPELGTYFVYAQYRAVIAEDCRNRCVYCDSHEDSIGGREAMQLDHFRPWNKSFGAAKEKRFASLENDPNNLVHSCGVCNRFKSARWPTEHPDIPHDEVKGWVDPFNELRCDFLDVQDDGIVTPAQPLGKYLIRVLRLNRPLLRRQRELKNIFSALEAACVPKWKGVIEADPDGEHAATARAALALLEIMRKHCYQN